MRHMTRGTTFIVLAVAAVFAALWIAYASDPGSAAATYRTRIMDQREEGEVIVNGRVAIRIRSAAGGYTAAERAQRVSERLNAAMTRGLEPDDITTGMVNGEAAVLADGELLVTADRFHAQINGTTPMRLAGVWAHNIRRALESDGPTGMTEPTPLSAEPGGSSEPASSEPGEPAGTVTATPLQQQYYPDWSTGAKKYVPILSVGKPGVRVGAAQVQGPAAQVKKVKAVAQLDLIFRGSFRMKVYVPVDSISLTSLRRVQGCSVAALVDIRILGL